MSTETDRTQLTELAETVESIPGNNHHNGSSHFPLADIERVPLVCDVHLSDLEKYFLWKRFLFEADRFDKKKDGYFERVGLSLTEEQLEEGKKIYQRLEQSVDVTEIDRPFIECLWWKVNGFLKGYTFCPVIGVGGSCQDTECQSLLEIIKGVDPENTDKLLMFKV
jgi:hypothetical protein